MHHKIYISITVVLVLLLSWTSFDNYGLKNKMVQDIGPVYHRNSLEIPISLADGRDWKACKTIILDKTLQRPEISDGYEISKDNTCPQFPKQIFITKQEYINYLQNNAGWGIFDGQSIYPDMIPPDIKQAYQSSSNSSK
jgi:hypothetical protein